MAEIAAVAFHQCFMRIQRRMQVCKIRYKLRLVVPIDKDPWFTSDANRETLTQFVHLVKFDQEIELLILASGCGQIRLNQILRLYGLFIF